MVSIKRNMGLLFINFMMFVCFMGLYTISNAAILCTGTQVQCCKGTTMSCCPHPGYDSNGVELFYDVSACMTIFPIDPDRPIIGPIDPIVEECTSGQTQYKPSGTCGTSSRTCCSSGSWSDWDAACPKTCSSSTKPTTYQTCTASNGKSGTQTRTVTCDTSTGTWTTGSWGTCTAPDCTSGETKTCPSNSNQVLKCTSSGTWSTSCSCENPGNGKVYCQGMAITVAQSSTCYHGIWSDTTCTGICCCSGDTPKLMSNGTPGCYGLNDNGISMWKSACVCQTASQIRENSGLL